MSFLRPCLRARPLKRLSTLHSTAASTRVPILLNSRTEKRQKGTMSQDPLEPILAGNKAWADHVKQNDPELLPSLAKGQSPKILWLGCADSRVPETTVLGLKPGDVFVHRNIANIVSPTDLSAVSIIEFAVNNIGVQHIILCGHTSCGGVAGALGNKKIGKIDTWLAPLRELRVQHAIHMETLSDKDKSRLLVELNVKRGIDVLRSNPDVIAAKKSRGLTVHGVVFNLETGQLEKVDTKDGHEELRAEVFGTE